MNTAGRLWNDIEFSRSAFPVSFEEGSVSKRIFFRIPYCIYNFRLNAFIPETILIFRLSLFFSA